MAESIAIEAAKSVAELVKARGCEEITLAWNFQDHFAKLSDSKLLYAKAAFQKSVGNANKHSDENDEQVNSWLQQVKDAVYDAEDVMDDYEYEKLRRKIEVRSSKRKVYNFLNCKTNPVVFRFKMTHKVLDVLSKFDELNKKAKTIGLLKQAGSSSSFNSNIADDEDNKLQQIREHAPIVPYEYVGRKDVEMELLQMICDATTHKEGLLHTIAIQGIGGLGKTTLARGLFHHNEVDKQFGKNKVWICVSEDFNVDRLLKEMLESLASHNHGLTNSGAIIKKLQEVLKGGKFLLVLDDVWDPNEVLWECLRNELQRIGDPSKSVILVTTRITEVANKSRANHIHKLKGLSEDDGWTLLGQKACISMSSSQEYTKFEEIGRKIVNKCAGVPLAIKAMGPLLQSRKNPRDWEHILTTELSDLPQDKENYILPSLRLSYNHLPSVAVKQCFAYCAIFPKDTKLDKHVLITLWMAQGFLQRTNNNMTSTMEDIGEDYFAHLIHHSFLEEERVVDWIIGTKSYKMHDLVHDLAIDVSTSGKDLFVWKANIQEKEVSLFDFRHLAICFETGEATPEFPTEVTMHKIRTVNFWGNLSRWDSIICAKYIRVLIVANIGLSVIPPDIGQLIHLRYLDLSRNYKITALPESLCILYQLQTLRLEGNDKLKELPKELFKLRNLRHIDYNYDYRFEFLINLSDGFGLSASRGLGLLTDLQTLPTLKLCDEDERWTIDELESLNEIKGVMEISGLEHVKNKEKARKASLRSKGGIIMLVLKWSSRDEDSNNEMMDMDEDVLVGLELPPNIKDLCVKGFRGLRFPNSWMVVSNNLSRVVLGDCKRCKQLPTLGQLPSLEYLKLEGFSEVESIGNEFYVENTSSSNIDEREGQGVVVFGALRELYIWEFESLTSWMPFATSSAFPILEVLYIRSCPKLERVPALHFQSLKSLSLITVGGSQPLDIIKYSQGLKELYVRKIVSPEKEEWSIPQELFNCSNLEKLTIAECENLKSIGIPNPNPNPNPNGEMLMMSSLKKLEIANCPALSLSSIPSSRSVGKCTSLWKLCLCGGCLSIRIGMEGDVPDLIQLKRLEELIVVNAGEMMMTSAARSIPQLDSLRELEIGEFKDEEEITKFVSQIKSTTRTTPHSLSKVTLWGWPKVKKMPEQLQHLLPSSTLEHLEILMFYELEQLPDWIANLSSLKILKLFDCKKLKYLPSKQAMLRLSQLQQLRISYCPQLKERCEKHSNNDNGPPDSESHGPISHIFPILRSIGRLFKTCVKTLWILSNIQAHPQLESESKLLIHFDHDGSILMRLGCVGSSSSVLNAGNVRYMLDVDDGSMLLEKLCLQEIEQQIKAVVQEAVLDDR